MEWYQVVLTKDNVNWLDDNGLMEKFFTIEEVFFKDKLNACGYLSLIEVLTSLGIRPRKDQVLAGWTNTSYEQIVGIMEIIPCQDFYVINFLNCDQILLDRIYKGEITIK